jgi:ABC-type branched-subunit amino acid transport system ATPase component
VSERAPERGRALLSLQSVAREFGGLKVLQDLTLAVRAGTIPTARARPRCST